MQVGAEAALSLCRSGSFRELLKGLAVALQNAACDDVDLFLVRQFKIGVFAQGDEHIARAVVFEQNDAAVLIGKFGGFGKVLVCFAHGEHLIGIDDHGFTSAPIIHED